MELQLIRLVQDSGFRRPLTADDPAAPGISSLPLAVKLADRPTILRQDGPRRNVAASGRVRSLLRGYSKTSADPALPRRLMTLLLHRLSDLGAQRRIEGWHHKAADFYELERLLWPI
jgi:hypothetical protein